MKPVGRYELAQAWATGGEFPQNLAERFGSEFYLGDSGAFSGDAQKFNVHGDGGGPCPAEARSAMADNLMITWAFNRS